MLPALIAIAMMCGPVAVILLLSTRLGRSARTRITPPYGSKPLLTAWERRTLQAFQCQVPRGFYVCPQVRLVDMLSIAAEAPGGRFTALSRVVGKSVDFAIVEVASGRVALVVELDDRSHRAPDRRARDRFVNETLAAACIPLLRFRPGQTPDLREFFNAADEDGVVHPWLPEAPRPKEEAVGGRDRRVDATFSLHRQLVR